MTKRKAQLWIWKVTPLNKRDTRELWEGQRKDLKKSVKEVWICKEKRKGLWECKMIKGTRWIKKKGANKK